MAVVSCFSLGATASAAENPEQIFKDVEPGTWYYEGVEYVNDLGLMTGMGGESEGYFRPDEYLQRQDLALILARYYQKYVDSELDLDESNEVYYKNAVAIGDPIVRQDMCLALDRHLNALCAIAYTPVVPEYGLSHFFPDGAQVSGYAYNAVYYMYVNEVIQGEGIDVKLLNPQGKVTRGMAAVMIQRYLEAFEEHYLSNAHKDLLL